MMEGWMGSADPVSPQYYLTSCWVLWVIWASGLKYIGFGPPSPGEKQKNLAAFVFGIIPAGFSALILSAILKSPRAILVLLTLGVCGGSCFWIVSKVKPMKE